MAKGRYVDTPDCESAGPGSNGGASTHMDLNLTEYDMQCMSYTGFPVELMNSGPLGIPLGSMDIHPDDFK